MTGGPVVIKNIKILNVRRRGISIFPTTNKANFKVEKVSIDKTSTYGASGAPLYISDAQWVTVSDSSFIQSGSDTAPTIELTSTGSSVGIYSFKNVTTAGRTIKLTGEPGNFEWSQVTFENIVYENGNDEGMFTIDTKPGANGIGWRGLSFLDCQSADTALSSGIALLKSAPTNDGGLIEGVVVRNPAYFAQGIFKPAATGPQEIQGLIVEGIQNSSGAMPIGQHDRYLAVYKPGTRVGTLSVDNTLRLMMPRPSGVVATGFATGGTLAAGTYHYVVAALDPDGNQTYISDEKSCVVSSGTTGRCDLSWTAVPGSVSYRIYGRGQATFYSAQNKPNYGTSTAAAFSDTGSLPNSGPPPTLLNDPAAAFKFSPGGPSWIKNGNNFGIGTASPGAPLDVVGKIRTDNQLESTVATGTAPLIVASTTRVNNLNAQKWDGKDALDFSSSLDFGSIAAQTCAELTITVTGATTNSPVAPAWPPALELGLAGLMRVSAADVVSVRLCNPTAAAIDPASQTFAGRVIR